MRSAWSKKNLVTGTLAHGMFEAVCQHRYDASASCLSRLEKPSIGGDINSDNMSYLRVVYLRGLINAIFTVHKLLASWISQRRPAQFSTHNAVAWWWS
jgi:hypothetical protein